MKKVALALMAIAALTSCDNKNKATINGQFFGAANRNIILEELSPSGGRIADSVRTNSDGKFSFKIDFSDKDNPTFYNVRLDNQFAPLLVEGGETVELSALGNIYINYTVSGSKGSELLNQFNRQTVGISLKLDSINQLYNLAATDERIAELGREYSREYVKLKQSTISFVMHNASSLVSIVPLYQPTYNGEMLFNDPMDIIYYRAIADSLGQKYPTSPYVNSLRNDIKRVDNVYTMDSIVNQSMLNTLEFPEITMRDATGTIQKLSSLNGKNILLSFTTSTDPKLKALNRELFEIYKNYQDIGLVIFEVSVETDKAAWLRNITDNKFPWIQVSDIQGVNSSALLSYNVKSIPTYFVIDSDGVLADVNIKHADLEKSLAKLRKK